MSARRSTVTLKADAFAAPKLVLAGSGVTGRIYWADSGNEKIQRAHLDGSNVEDLVSITAPKSIALDRAGGRMYWGKVVGPHSIMRADLNGTGVEVLAAAPVDEPYGIAIDHANGKFYWLNNDQDEIQRANLDGSGSEHLLTLNPPPFGNGLGGIDLDPAQGKMYFTDFIAHRIYRANLDGSGIQTLISSGLTFPCGIALDSMGGKMYWADAGRIRRANLNGTGMEDLVTGLVDARGIALDVVAGKVYWSDIDAHKIQRANLNGSNVEDLITTGITTPIDIDVIPLSKPVTMTESGRVEVAVARRESEARAVARKKARRQR